MRAITFFDLSGKSIDEAHAVIAWAGRQHILLSGYLAIERTIQPRRIESARH
jgi:hypothetical protein